MKNGRVRAGGWQNGIAEGNSEIWDLKYKDSHYLEIRLKKCNNSHLIHNLRTKIDKGGERIRVFENWDKEYEMTNDKKN